MHWELQSNNYTLRNKIKILHLNNRVFTTLISISGFLNYSSKLAKAKNYMCHITTLIVPCYCEINSSTKFQNKHYHNTIAIIAIRYCHVFPSSLENNTFKYIYCRSRYCCSMLGTWKSTLCFLYSTRIMIFTCTWDAEIQRCSSYWVIISVSGVSPSFSCDFQGV